MWAKVFPSTHLVSLALRGHVHELKGAVFAYPEVTQRVDNEYVITRILGGFVGGLKILGRIRIERQYVEVEQVGVLGQ